MIFMPIPLQLQTQLILTEPQRDQSGDGSVIDKEALLRYNYMG